MTQAERLYNEAQQRERDLKKELVRKEADFVLIKSTYEATQNRVNEHIVGPPDCLLDGKQIRIHPDRSSPSMLTAIRTCNKFIMIPGVNAIRAAHEELVYRDEKKSIYDSALSVINKLKEDIKSTEADVKAKYKSWIEDKKANMTAEELSDYANIEVDAQSKISKDRNKTFAIIGVSFVALIALGYFVYRRYLN